jgi:hypothetical protein
MKQHNDAEIQRHRRRLAGLSGHPGLVCQLYKHRRRKSIMKLSKSQLKQIIKEELKHLQEIEYDEHGPMYVKPVKGVTTPDEAEVLVPDYGGMEIEQIKDQIATGLANMAEAAAAGEFRRIGGSRLGGVLKLFYDTLKEHGALDPAVQTSDDFDDWADQIISYFEMRRDVDIDVAQRVVLAAEDDLRAKWESGRDWQAVAAELYADYAEGAEDMYQ